MAFKLKNHLPKSVFDQYLRIVVVSTKIPLSQLRQLLKDVQKFDHARTELKKIYICMEAKCDAVLTADIKGLQTRRQPCGHLYDKDKGSCYSFVLPIKQQLICLLKNGNLGLKKKMYTSSLIAVLYTSFLRSFPNLFMIFILFLKWHFRFHRIKRLKR